MVTRACSNTDLAYLAGVVDADGYVTAAYSWSKYRPSVGAKCGITGTDRSPHDLAASIFGGNVIEARVPGGRPGREVAYHWCHQGAGAVETLQAILPYLRVKRERAELALELQAEVELARQMRVSDEPYPWFVAGFDPIPALMVRAEEIRSMNSRTRASTRSYCPDPVLVAPGPEVRFVISNEVRRRLLNGHPVDEYPA